MNTHSQKSVTSRDFMHDLQAILRDGENLFKGAGQQLWNEYLAARECLGLSINTPTPAARHGLTSLEESILMQARGLVNGANAFVKQNPWRVAAAGICIGLVIGAVVAERR